jgi:uncharacterized protein (DUF433 family)
MRSGIKIAGGSHKNTVRKFMNKQSWIVADAEHLGGKPRVWGTRISMAFLLLECLAAGMSVKEVVAE